MRSLSEVKIFQRFTDAQLLRLEQVGRYETYPRGKVLFDVGDPSDELFGIIDGRVRMMVYRDGGKELTMAYHIAGELFGESALLSEEPRTIKAITAEKSIVWKIPKKYMQEVAENSAPFMLELSNIIARRRNDLENRMESLVFRDVPSRLADQILRLIDTYGVEEKDGIRIGLKLSQLELASLIGATRETTSTSLNSLKKLGILETSHRSIVVKDVDALEEIKDSMI